MSAGLYVNDGGATRKLKKLYTNVGGVTRELKELWVNDAGVTRKIFSVGAQMSGTPTFVSDRSTGFSWSTKSYSVSTSGISVKVGITAPKGNFNPLLFGIAIPIDLGDTVAFKHNSKGIPEITCLRVDSDINATGYGDFSPSHYNIRLCTSNDMDSDSYLSGEIDRAKAQNYLLVAGYTTTTVTTTVIQQIYLEAYASTDSWDFTESVSMGLKFTIPNEALTIIGGSGEEYPISFS